VDSKNCLKSRRETNEAFIVVVGSVVRCSWHRSHWSHRLPTTRRLSKRGLLRAYRWLFVAWLRRFQLPRLSNGIPGRLGPVPKLHGTQRIWHSQCSSDARIGYSITTCSTISGKQPEALAMRFSQKPLKIRVAL